MSRYVRARPDAPDRRFNPRCLTNVRGQIILSDGGRRACLVRDMSAGGARLILDEALHLPQVLQLVIGQNGRPRSVRVVWFEGRQVGIARTSGADI